jgi:RNA polymerase sigma factor (sigma-70 family)
MKKTKEELRLIAAMRDSILIAAHIAGNKNAFNTIVKIYHLKMVNYINCYYKDINLAQNKIQDLWILVLELITDNKYNEMQCFERWIRSLAFKTYTKDARKKNIFDYKNDFPDKEQDIKDPVDMDDEAGELEERLQCDKMDADLQWAISQLNERDRFLIVSISFEGKSYEEVNILLDFVGEDYIRSAFFKAKAKLKKLLG